MTSCPIPLPQAYKGKQPNICKAWYVATIWVVAVSVAWHISVGSVWLMGQEYRGDRVRIVTGVYVRILSRPSCQLSHRDSPERNLTPERNVA